MHVNIRLVCVCVCVWGGGGGGIRDAGDRPHFVAGTNIIANFFTENLVIPTTSAVRPITTSVCQISSISFIIVSVPC